MTSSQTSKGTLPMPNPLQIGIVVFPNVTQLDFTGPLQVFSSLPDTTVHLLWKRIEPVTSDTVLTVLPTTSFADCPPLDVICVPGGACEVRHVGLHGIAGAGRSRPVGGIQGNHALDRDGISRTVRGTADQDA